MEKKIRVGLSLSESQVKYLKSECEKIGSRVGLASLSYDVLCERFPRLKGLASAAPSPLQVSMFGAATTTKKTPKGARGMIKVRARG